MSDGSEHRRSKTPLAGRFATTRWSVVLDAGGPPSPRGREALATLCRTYWFPLYGYLRRRGFDTHEAEDHTQAFLSRLLEKQDLGLANPERGRFRSFLLAALNHFLSNERDRARALKRGGERKIVSLDLENAEDQFSLEPADELTPQKLFDRSWALTVLDQTMARLRDEWVKSDKEKFFERLKSYLAATRGAVPYRAVAEELDMSEGAVKVAVHRLRKRYRELLREEISQTVADETQIDEEIRDLFAALRG